LQVSGLRVTLDLPRRPALVDNDSKLLQAGHRVVSVEVLSEKGWSELDEEKTCDVTAPSWVTLYGGDKHYIFREDSVTKENLEKDDVENLAQYIRHIGKTVTLEEQGRIVIKDL
jgi:5'-nucleotidase